MSIHKPDVQTIFNAAVALPSDEERARYLDSVCQDDAELKARAQALLRAHSNAGSFLGGKPADLDRTEWQAGSEGPGVQLGPYKLLEEIGQGGMGVVYMAEQLEPVRRKVALKIIKPGMDTRQVIARFEAERQALSLMDHPHIAKVLDAGSTESGRPYFVMELVKGEPITEYCDRRQLTPRRRLELLLPVCQAIQHAHQKGIIHRDIKPSNILVAEYDEQPVPKVIDFGVAKAVGQALTEKTMFTGIGQIVGTLEYMAPEQAKLNQLDIDTRCDIYSLGVLLYELLTGATPFDKQRLRSAGIDEMLRIIREEEPPKPSTRLWDSRFSLPSVSAQRRMEPSRLTRLVRGDLDWIVMKALEKDRSRRYETAIGLAQDLDRYLHDLAVEACPPSAGYRFRKFARRNRGTIVTVGLIAVTLVAATAVSVWQAVRATQAENVAQDRQRQSEENFQKARQVVNEYFTLVSESKLLDAPGLQPLRKDLLEAALTYYRGMLDQHEDDPTVLADLASSGMRVGIIYHLLDRNDDSHAAFEAALPLVERLHREHPDSPELWRQIAGVFLAARSVDGTRMPKDPPAMERTLARTLSVWEILARENPTIDGFEGDIAFLRFLSGLLETGRAAAGDGAARARADAHYQQGVVILERYLRIHPQSIGHRQLLAKVYGNLSANLKLQGRDDDSRRTLARKKELESDALQQSPDHFLNRARRVRALVDDADSLKKSDPHRAEQKYLEALSAGQRQISDFPAASEYRINLAQAHFKLADLLAIDLQKPLEAQKATQQGVEVLATADSDFRTDRSARPKFAYTMRETARKVIAHPKRIAEVESLRRQDILVFERLCREEPEDPYWLLQFAYACLELGGDFLQADCYRDAELAFSEAIPALDARLALLRRSSGDAAAVAMTLRLLSDTHFRTGQARLKQHQLELADDAIRKSLQVGDELIAQFPQTDVDYRLLSANRYNDWAFSIPADQRATEGERLVRKAIEIKQKLTNEFPDNSHFKYHLAHSVLGLGLIQTDAGQKAMAQQSFGEVQQLLFAVCGDAAEVKSLKAPLGHVLWRLGEAWLNQDRLQNAWEVQLKALQLFESLAAAEPKVPYFRQEQAFTHRHLANVAEREGREQVADQHLKQAILFYDALGVEFPENRFYRGESGFCYWLIGLRAERAGRWSDAAAAFRSAGDQHVFHANSVAWHLVSSADAAGEAASLGRELAQRAVQWEADNGQCWLTLAVAHYRASDWKAALAAMTKATELRNGGNPFDGFLLAMIQWRLDQRDQARASFRQAEAAMATNQPKDQALTGFRAEAKKLLGDLDQTGE